MDFWGWLGSLFGGGNSSSGSSSSSRSGSSSSSSSSRGGSTGGGSAGSGSRSSGGGSSESRPQAQPERQNWGQPRQQGSGTRSRQGGGTFERNDTPEGVGTAYDNPLTMTHRANSLWGAALVGDQASFEGTKRAFAGRDDPEIQKETAAAKALRDLEAARAGYSEGLGDSEVNTKELTRDEYLALSPRQRAAVDANTAIVAAVKADRENPTGTRDEKYEATVTKLFGEGGGSDTFAPRTVAVLDALGLGDVRNDLDNFLDRRALVSADDLKGLSDERVNAMLKVPSQVRETQGMFGVRQENALNYSQRAQRSLSDVMANGQTLLNKLRGSSSDLFGQQEQLLGSMSSVDPNGRDGYLDKFFETMATRGGVYSGNAQLALDDLASFSQEFGLSNEQLGDYFERRLQAYEYDLNTNKILGNTEGGDYLSPKEFRQLYLSGGK